MIISYLKSYNCVQINKWFHLLSLFKGNSIFMAYFNAKAILVERQYCCYFIYN